MLCPADVFLLHMLSDLFSLLENAFFSFLSNISGIIFFLGVSLFVSGKSVATEKEEKKIKIALVLV